MISILTKAIVFAVASMVFIAVDMLQTFLVLPLRLLADGVKRTR